MGKSKSSRRQNRRRHNPVGTTDERTSKKRKEQSPQQDADSVDSTNASVLESILGQLTSTDPSTRSTALTSISIMASQKQQLSLLKNRRMLQALVPLLEGSTLKGAAGALRNLSSVDDQLCDLLVEENVMDKVVDVLKENFATWTPTSQGQQQPQLEEATLVQCVALLWNLCESSSKAVQIATQNKLHVTLTRYLDYATFGLALSTTVAHCLYTLTEDNKFSLSSTQSLSKILTIQLETATPPQLLIPALGILLNISSDDYTKLPPQIQSSFFQLITTALTVNHVDLINKLSSDLPLSGVELHLANEQAGEEINNAINYMKTALEIFSNVVCIDSDPETNSNSDSDMECDDDGDCQLSPTLPVTLYTNLTNHLPTLLPLIQLACQPIPVNVQGILKINKLFRLLSNLTQLRMTALISLQNLFESSIPLEALEKAIPTGEILSFLMKLLQNVEPSETELLESITSSIRSLLLLWTNEKKQVQDLNTFIPPFVDLYHKTAIDRIKINVIKILGSVCLLTSYSDPTHLPLLKETGLFMKQCLSGPVNKNNLLVVVELLDTLMDMFAEDDCDGIIVEIGLLGRLKGLTGEVKKVSRMERKSLGVEEKAVVQVVLDNLPRFLEYKGKRSNC